MRNGIAYRLPPLVPRISGTGCSWWPTPAASDAFTENLKSKHGPDSIHLSTIGQYVKMWPTPRAADCKRGPDYGATANHQGGGNLLGAVMTAEKASGQLNPAWVEWLMGFPVGWTDFEDSATQ